MKYELVGFKVSKGSFVDNDSGSLIVYDNVNLHCVGESFDHSHNGYEVSVIKVKSKFVDIDMLCDLVGRQIDIEFVPRGGKCVPCGVHPVE